MENLSYQDVFVPGGFPKHTYNARAALKLEPRLQEALHNLCKLVTVTGQTKSGKTVLSKKIFPAARSVWVDGGSVSSDDDFWQLIVDQLRGNQSVTNSDSSQKSVEIAASGEFGLSTLFAGMKTTVGGKTSAGKQNGVSVTRVLSNRVVALTLLRSSAAALVIDDFHYINRDLQGRIVRALKPLIFEGVPVIVIAIPHRRYDALKVEKEMTGRIAPIEIDSWSDDELTFIPRRGFELLKGTLTPEAELHFATEAIGSPHLMQEFCRYLSKQTLESGKSLIGHISPTKQDVEAIFRDVADTIGRPIFEKLARGPRTRTDRLPRQLKSGATGDIYVVVLHALAHLRPGLISLEYEDLRGAIRDVSASQAPKMQEVVRVLKQMATIASSDASSTPVIDFEEKDQKLHITDPFFAFYLRWGKLIG